MKKGKEMVVNSLWKGCLNPKEYYIKYIKTENDRHLSKQRQAADRALTVIRKMDDSAEEAKKAFDRNVEKYMLKLTIEEKQAREAAT